MQRFKNILLVLRDGNLAGPATQRALALTRRNNARLTVVDVLSLKGFGLSLTSFTGKTEELQEDMRRERGEELTLLFQSLADELDIHTEVLTGKPFVEIIRYVIENDCDLIIKEVSDEKRFAAILFGSTDLRLLRKCPCPVWLVKPDDLAQTRKVMAAIELEAFEDESEMDRLDQQISEIASSLAFLEGSELHLVNAWFVLDGEELAKKLSKHYEEDASNWVAEQKRAIEKSQRALCKRFEAYVKRQNMEDLTYSFHFQEGEAEEVLVEHVTAHSIDLVVMGTVARTDLAGFLVGNTSEAVLNQINSSVLAVKPPGFISPVGTSGRD